MKEDDCQALLEKAAREEARQEALEPSRRNYTLARLLYRSAAERGSEEAEDALMRLEFLPERTSGRRGSRSFMLLIAFALTVLMSFLWYAIMKN